jgi:hypothetical protein
VSNIAVSTVVTAALLEEFRLMKFSFELFHNSNYQWFVRCDQASEVGLREDANVTCHVFAECERSRHEIESQAFRAIAREKMAAVGDAWSAANWEGVAYFDADLIFTAPVMEQVFAIDAEIVLTPHYFPSDARHLAPIRGYYNSGFVFIREREFWKWWRDAFDSHLLSYADQQCLNDASQHFKVGVLGDSANIGLWRCSDIPDYASIPQSCLFLHVHSFQNLRTARGWADKSYAAHCLKFLCTSAVPEHRLLANEILRRDHSGWYAASLRLS